MKYLIAVLILMLLPHSALCLDLKSKEAQALSEELRLSINKTILRIVEYEKAAGISPSKVDLLLQQEAGTDSLLGAVLDNNNRVILITPKSNARKLGLEVGDVIDKFFVDNKVVDPKVGIKFKNSSELKVHVSRNSNQLVLSENVEAAQLPSWKLQIFNDVALYNAKTRINEINTSAGCGRISVFFRPPKANQLYSASIFRVDGQGVLTGLKTMKLKPGIHSIYLHELINVGALRPIRSSLRKSKLLKVNVEPNKTYYLGAKYISANRFQRGEQYWEPVIWKVTDKKCKM